LLVIESSADTLLDLAEECPDEEAGRVAVDFPWLASSVAELMLAHHRQPLAEWFTVYRRDVVDQFEHRGGKR
jgi:hypothetical protein